MVSVAAPGANGTMMRIGRDGYCPSAADDTHGARSDNTTTAAAVFGFICLLSPPIR
jgi:hypothetical protein